jgi:hypothetical protein
MVRVHERRRHERLNLTFPAVIRDNSGRVLLRGRSADIAAGGIRIVGRGGDGLHDGLEVWVELTVPSVRSSGPPDRVVKLRGEVRRISIMGEWRSAVVVVFESNFSEHLLDPVG